MTNEIIDPRQELCLKYYKSPDSDTFGNLSGSLRRAGYSKAYSTNISNRKPIWLTDNLHSTVDMIIKSEINLKKMVDHQIDIHSELNKTEVELLKMQQDTSKFILKTLARQKYDQQDDKENNAIQVNINLYDKPIHEPIEIIPE